MEYGIFPCLFVYLLFYVLKENGKRESNYQKVISDLAERFKILENVQADIKEIKDYIEEDKK